MRRRKAREYALQLLFQLEITEKPFDNAVLEEFWSDKKEDREIKEFTLDLIEGTLKHRDSLDKVIKKVAEHWSMERMAIVDRCILRFAAYELLYREDIPPSVTINEAIEVAKKFSTTDSASFINGILDRIAKSKRA